MNAVGFPVDPKGPRSGSGLALPSAPALEPGVTARAEWVSRYDDKVLRIVQFRDARGRRRPPDRPLTLTGSLG